MKEELKNILYGEYLLDDMKKIKFSELKDESDKLGIWISELKESTKYLWLIHKKNNDYEICFNINNDEYINNTIFRYLIYCFKNNNIEIWIWYIENKYLTEIENKIEIYLPSMKLIEKK